MSDKADPGQAPAMPPFDPKAPHHQHPYLRPVRGFPAKFGEQVVLGLADARQISDKVVFTTPAVQIVLPLMDGNRSVDQIVSEVGRGLTNDMLSQLVAQLDDAGLLFGPRFDALLQKVRADFDAGEVLPPGASAAFAESLVEAPEGTELSEADKRELSGKKLREIMDVWIAKALEKAEDPAFDELPSAIVAPHIDYPRGWMNYGAVWGRMRVTDRPDRVVILGTNHFGMGTGVVGCDKGFETPLGVCPYDRSLGESLRKSLGDKLFADRFDHEREHSIELQIAWIQHCLGKDDSGQYCPVFGALIHDPTVNQGESYDNRGVSLQAFVDALRTVISQLPGRTLVVASADLSHVGPAFGDQIALAGESEAANEARSRVFSLDREMLDLYAQGKPDELVSTMTWQQNSTRWCSLGNMVAAMQVVQPKRVRILNYAAVMDPEGAGMVSTAAVSMH